MVMEIWYLKYSLAWKLCNLFIYFLFTGKKIVQFSLINVWTQVHVGFLTWNGLMNKILKQ